VINREKVELLRIATLVITGVAAVLGVIAYLLGRDLFDGVMAVLWTILFIVIYNMEF
jgi:hypothetical protein